MSKMIQCKSCSKEIAANAKSCPGCGAKNKKPMYKRVWFWAVAIIIVAGTASCSNTDNSKEINSENTVVENKLEDKVEDKVEEKVEDNIPTEYKLALEKAQSYSDNMYMSKAGIYNQLTSEYGDKFTVEAGQYAIDNVEADWKENALKKAKVFQDTLAMSKTVMYNQLISEFGDMFTAEEAQYAVDNAGIDWKENALDAAKFYQEHMSMSKGAIYDQITSKYGDAFTPEEAQYAVDNLD